EGRRVINNIERSASLFIVKNIFSFVMALISLAFTFPYPVTPAQLSLVSSLTIGIPSFILAMEPNDSLVKGKFMRNVFYRALPGALTNIILIIGVMLFYYAFEFPSNEMSTICAIIMGVVGLMVLHKVCTPYNNIRKILMVSMTLVFTVMVLFFREFFTLSELDFSSKLVMAVFVLLAYPLMKTITMGLDKMEKSFSAVKGRHLQKQGRHLNTSKRR
ncbi:MAG: cation-translocating P-type ATPase, partial [Clostridiales bacterium]|nr:cation-translocating P-type ATPase [Clostridiales bacterium]